MSIINFFKKRSALAALLILILFGVVKFPALLSFSVALDIIRGYSMVGIVAVGMTFIILTGGIDLSVGSIAAVAGFSAAVLTDTFWLIPIIVPLVAGTALGLANGLFVGKLKVPPFVATLAMMMGARGVSLIISKEKPLGLKEISSSFAQLGQGDFLGIPILIWIFAIVVVTAIIVLNHTKFGREVYAVGGNEEAAKMMGVNVLRIKVIVYAISGFCSGIAGLLLTARLSSAQNTAGQGWELTAIASVVLGGTLLTGGRGNCSGTVYGVLIYAVIETLLGRFNVMAWWINIFTALLLLGVVIAQSQSEKNRKKRIGLDITEKIEVKA
jgi:ribose transport system permease protein